MSDVKILGVISHRGVVTWRKYAPLPLLITQMMGFYINNPYLFGVTSVLWLTIPCGIKIINNKWYLWYPRQIIFATLAGSAFFIK